MPNILKPQGTQNFPYWPGLGIQNFAAIPGHQMAGEVADIPINKGMRDEGYTVAPINRIPTPEALQDKKGASLFIDPTPRMGRGAGVGLTDMLLMSVAQTQAQGVSK